MTVENFEYLMNFVSCSDDNIKSPSNWFLPVSEDEIVEVEKRLGIKLPEQLYNFYKTIGYGSLKVPCNAPDDYKTYIENYIFPPSIIADILLYGHESGLISQDVLDFLQPGDLPFFHIYDSCLFLVMRPQSDMPNAVYNQWGELVEDNFNKFIWRLYYEDPSFYENI